MKCLSTVTNCAKSGLNVPQVTQIAQALNRLGVPMDPAVYTMEDAVRSVLALRGKEGGASC